MAPRKESPADARGLSALERDLAASGPRPAYLLTGDDRRDLDRAVALLQAAVVPEGLEGFNALALRGAEDTVEDVVAACEVLPLMGDRRLVVVREPERLKGDLGALAAALARPCPTTTLVLVPAQWDRRLAATKAIEGVAFKVDFAPPQGPELAGWIRRELAARSVRIEPDALALLIDLVAAETILLSHEIDKLALACRDGLVTRQDVDDLLGRTRTTDVWSLTNAIEDGDPAAALAALRRMTDEGAAVPMIVGMMDWCLGRLYAQEAPRAFPARQAALDRRRSELQGHGERLFGLLRETDRMVRTTGGASEAMLERFVLEAATAGGRASRPAGPRRA